MQYCLSVKSLRFLRYQFIYHLFSYIVFCISQSTHVHVKQQIHLLYLFICYLFSFTIFYILPSTHLHAKHSRRTSTIYLAIICFPLPFSVSFNQQIYTSNIADTPLFLYLSFVFLYHFLYPSSSTHQIQQMYLLYLSIYHLFSFKIFYVLQLTHIHIKHSRESSSFYLPFIRFPLPVSTSLSQRIYTSNILIADTPPLFPFKAHRADYLLYLVASTNSLPHHGS